MGAGAGATGEEKVLMQHEETMRSGTAGGRIKGSLLIFFFFFFFLTIVCSASDQPQELTEHAVKCVRECVFCA